MNVAQFDVVIPAYNAEAWLGACLDALLAAGFSPDGITVVDDGSSDRTAALAEGRGVNVLSPQANRGAAAARNAGAASRDGEIILFVDADVAVHANTRAVLEAFFAANPDHVAVFGAYDDDPASPQRISRARNLLHRFVHLEGAGEASTFWTGCGAVRRTAFESIGGFDERLHAMEDVDLGHRLVAAGGRIALLPELQGRHYKRWTLAGILRTDLFDRALPWARLLRSSGARPAEVLNISNRSRVSVLAVALGLCGLAAMTLFPASGFLALAAALVLLVAANAGFLGYVRSLDGFSALPAAVLVLVAHYFSGGLGFLLVRLGLDRWDRE